MDPAAGLYLSRPAKVVGNFMGDYRNERFIHIVHEVRLTLAARAFPRNPYLCGVPRVGEDVAIDAVQA